MIQGTRNCCNATSAANANVRTAAEATSLEISEISRGAMGCTARHGSSELSMVWLEYVSYFFGGAFLVNGIPHFVSGLMGRAFQSPFAKPPGKGLSSSTVNVLWGFANFVIAYLLIARVGNFDPHAADQVIAVFVGVLLLGVMAARSF